MEFEETELRLGLAYGGGGEKSNFTNGKRVFEETNDVDLKLNLSSMKETNDSNLKSSNHIVISNDDAVVLNPPPAKAQVVGWPPVRSFRKNAVMKKKAEPEAFVKVSMDGAPYLRKVDLKMYLTYQQLYHALAKMFSSFTIGKCDDDSEGMMMKKESIKLLNMDLLNGSDYVPTYEDKDGDWMLVGDVPWEMFVESCKRLRIMKGTDAKGLGN